MAVSAIVSRMPEEMFEKMFSLQYVSINRTVLYDVTLRLLNFLFLSGHNAALIPWLGLYTKTTLLGLGNYHGLAMRDGPASHVK